MSEDLTMGILLGVVAGFGLALIIVTAFQVTMWHDKCIVDKTTIASDLSFKEQREIASWVHSNYPDSAVYSDVFPEVREVCCCQNASGWDQVCSVRGTP